MTNRIGLVALMAIAAVSSAAFGEQIVDISKLGTAKQSVAINVQNAAYASCLAKNLELSGLFKVGPSGSVRVSGASGAVRAEGGGKVVSSSDAFADDKSARMAARRFCDQMVARYSDGKQKGFACDKVVFLNSGRQQVKNQARPSELCTSYPDGMDIRQLTSDAKMTVFPRWLGDGATVLYISDRRGAPQIWQLNTVTGQRSLKWSFKGTPAGIAVSPDGSKVAAILSIHGNPELYILQGDSWTRLTNTPLASEGCPTWSPDGRSIAYVSDETRHPQIYVIDIATRKTRRLTSKGTQNVDPDWGKDARIAYVTRRGGAYVAVMSPAEGDKTAQLVTEASNWEHPTWTRDSRHVIANRDKALFSIDTMPDGDKPRQLFSANGNWNSACIIK